MEDSSEVHSEERRVSPEKNNKRILKTPAQLNALENFYNEHKYPTEEMKSEVAEQLGLTEKQISSWFCHRRLKDKRRDEVCAATNGRQDRSSGIIQDRGSGLRQDSCGSTKQADYRNFEPREVESQRLYSRNSLAADMGIGSGMDNISSESNSSLQDKLFSQSEDPCDVETSAYVAKNGAIMPLISKGANKHKPSGYLKVKGEIENAAITAVKRQLGRHYQEDGPPLGVEFEPLPPGAFAAPRRELVNGPFYVGDLARNCSPDLSRFQKQSSKKCEAYSSKIAYLDSYVEGGNCNPNLVSGFYNKKAHQPKRRSTSYNCSDSNPGGNSAMENYDLAGETSVYSDERNHKMRSKPGAKGLRSNSIPNYHGVDGGRKSTGDHTEPWLEEYDDGNSKIVQRNDFVSKSSNLILGSSKHLDPEERAPHKRMEKQEKPYGGIEGTKCYHDQVRTKMHPANERTVAKHNKVEFPQHDYVSKAALHDVSRRRYPAKGSAVEKPSSFSEDETAETSSSVD